MHRRREFTFKPQWCKLAIDMMSQGASLGEVYAACGITRRQGDYLRKSNTKWDAALTQGQELAEAWWVRVGRENLYNPKGFSYVGWYMQMKNRFGWRDSATVESKGTIDVNQAIAQVQVEETGKLLAKELADEADTTSKH